MNLQKNTVGIYRVISRWESKSYGGCIRASLGYCGFKGGKLDPTSRTS